MDTLIRDPLDKCPSFISVDKNHIKLPLLLPLWNTALSLPSCRGLSFFLLRRYCCALSRLKCCNSMRLSSFNHQTSAFLCDSGVWVAFSQWEPLKNLVRKAREAHDGQFPCGLNNNVKYVWEMWKTILVFRKIQHDKQNTPLEVLCICLYF